MINILGLVLSMVAIAVSGWAAMRQVTLTRGSSNLQVTTDVLIAQFGDRDFSG
jgi:hypothetical protein